MTRYVYNGPVSGATLRDKEVMLHPGQEVDLDPVCPYTRTLIAQNLLTPVVAAETGSAAAPDPIPEPAPKTKGGKP